MEGNQMKMRETLLAIKEVAGRDMRHHVSMSESDKTSIRAWSNLFVSLVDSALSAPPRNCDLFTTWEAALSAFCEETGNSKPLELWLGCEIQSFAIWLFAPAKPEAKGESNGSK